MSGLDRLKSEGAEEFNIVYTVASYLSTATDIKADEAAELVLDLISYGNYTEARYCIDNLKRNGIHSYDLLALHGLCYFNEMHPELALVEIEEAHSGDPGNAKIKTLFDQVNNNGPEIPTADELIASAVDLISQRQYAESDHLLDQVLQLEQANHQALYYKGLIRVHREDYDSALYFLTFAKSSEPLEQYSSFIQWTQMVKTGDSIIRTNPGSYQGYMQKSQGLASMELFELAQVTLNLGLQKNPNNLNLILAKALVWVQSGQTERAKKYLFELEQQGLAIDPSLKERIFLQQE